MIHKLNPKLNFTFFILCRNLICCKTSQFENVTDHPPPTFTSFLIWFCLFQSLTWARSWRPDIMRTTPALNSHTAVSRTTGWRGCCGDGDGSLAPVPFVRTAATSSITKKEPGCAGHVLTSAPTRQQVSLSYNLNIGLCCEDDHTHMNGLEKSGDSENL